MTTAELSLLAGTIAASSIRFATPLALASLGETLSERAGVLNIGIEGVMLASALAAFLGSLATGSALAGVAAALAVGLVLSAIFALAVLGLGTDQVVSGLGLNLLAAGAAATAYRVAVGATGTSAQLAPLPRHAVPGLSRVPILGPGLHEAFEQDIFVPLTVVLAVALAWLIRRSTWGIALRATGDAPLAAALAGVSVTRVRATAVLLGGACTSLAGADLALSHALSFTEDLTNGRGFMALALVIFARWSPGRVVLAALFFGGAQAAEVAIQARGIVIAGYPLSRTRELVLALPYLLTLAVLALPRRSGREEAPAALGVNFPA